MSVPDILVYCRPGSEPALLKRLEPMAGEQKWFIEADAADRRALSSFKAFIRRTRHRPLIALVTSLTDLGDDVSDACRTVDQFQDQNPNLTLITLRDGVYRFALSEAEFRAHVFIIVRFYDQADPQTRDLPYSRIGSM